MGLLDKILGRDKKAEGDMTGDTSMQHEGAAPESEGAAKDGGAQHEATAQEPENT
jgi:uncharacterized protein YjbJ (UPF0337 family)